MSRVAPCKKCGNTDPPDTSCSWCGGHGMVTGYDGNPEDCSHCGSSGIQWPPVCPQCCGFRKAAA